MIVAEKKFQGEEKQTALLKNVAELISKDVRLMLMNYPKRFYAQNFCGKFKTNKMERNIMLRAVAHCTDQADKQDAMHLSTENLKNKGLYTPGQPCLTVTSEWRKIIRWDPSAFINNRKG